MKWGRKKSPGLSPLPQIFPISWLSMLKQKSTTPRTSSRPSKPKQNNNKQESPKSSSSIPVCFRPSRLSDGGGIAREINVCSVPETPGKSSENLAAFVVREDDFWKFSFEKHTNESKDGGVSLEGDEIEFQFSSRDSSRPRTPKKHRELIAPNSRKSDQRIAKENTVSLNSERKLDMSEDEQRDNESAKSPRPNRDLHKKKTRHRLRTGERSPRAGLRMEMCKIRAVEDLKKADKKRKKKKKKKKRMKHKGRSFESFAVVKCSLNPHEDFRESMMEMICANGIGEQEMENLLACYLSLNSDEHHGIILEVFRQVWFDLIQDSSDSEFEQGISYSKY